MTSVPEGLRYTKEHEWVLVEGDVATVGITDYAQDSLSDVVFVELPTIGAPVRQFQKVGLVESVKSVSDLYTPIGGVVVAVNTELEAAPETVNKDPYGKGWMWKVKLADRGQLDTLLDAAGYQGFLGH